MIWEGIAVKSLSRIIGVLGIAFVFGGCAGVSPNAGWVTLIDGEKGLENFGQLGEANWRAEGGAIVADKGKGNSNFLLSKKSYKDFELRVEFWADHTTNSGIFIRIPNPDKINGNPYEVNIYDQRPGPEYGTGGIPSYASVPVPNPHKAGGKWNTYEIFAKGPELTVKLNGVVTVSITDKSSLSGPFALQFGNRAKGAPGGPIKWRKVEIREL